MSRLGTALGANASTFIGLAGIGDVILTCTDDQSRNRRFGLAIGRGGSVRTALADIGQVVEGVDAAELVLTLAQKHGIDLPITHMVCNALQGKLSISDAVDALFSRVLTSE